MKLPALGVESRCLHCCRELVPASPATWHPFAPVLCERCRLVPGFRRLYRRRVGWSPSWERHIRDLTHRALRNQPLFQENDPHPQLRLPYKRRRKQAI